MSTETKKVEVTYEQVLNFRRSAMNYQMNHAQQFRKFLFALTKMQKKTAPLEDEYNDEQRLLNFEFCHKDDKGFAVMEKFTQEKRGEKNEEERFKFKIEESKKLAVKQRELLHKKVEIEPFYSDDYPDDLDFSWWNVFAPFVLPELEVMDQSEEGRETLEKLYVRTAEKTKPKMTAS
jgi:hypothetical protein